MTICPLCAADLQGAPIPEESRKFYGTATHFGREIGVEIPGVYDGILFWTCPDCGGAWHRFPEGDYRRERAEKYVP